MCYSAAAKASNSHYAKGRLDTKLEEFPKILRVAFDPFFWLVFRQFRAVFPKKGLSSCITHSGSLPNDNNDNAVMIFST